MLLHEVLTPNITLGAVLGEPGSHMHHEGYHSEGSCQQGSLSNMLCLQYDTCPCKHNMLYTETSLLITSF